MFTLFIFLLVFLCSVLPLTFLIIFIWTDTIFILILVHHQLLVFLNHALQVLENHFTSEEAPNQCLHFNYRKHSPLVDLYAVFLIFVIFIAFKFLLGLLMLTRSKLIHDILCRSSVIFTTMMDVPPHVFRATGVFHHAIFKFRRNVCPTLKHLR